MTTCDAAARVRALDTKTSFAVSAPAGSGKTGLLVQRVLTLLARCDEPEQVLAITFTRKAAAEMQSRIIEAITQAAHTPEPKEDYLQQTWQLARDVLQRDKEKQWQLLQCPNRLRITTIDSLCRSISENMPFDSLLGSVPEVLDNPYIAYEAASRDTLAWIHTQHPLQDDLIRLVKHFDNHLEKIAQLFIQLLAKRDQWLSVIVQSNNQRNVLETMLQAVLDKELAYTRELLSPVASELIILADHAAKNFTRAELAPKATDSPIRYCLGLADLPTATSDNHQQRKIWAGMSELLTTQKGTIRAKPTKDIGFFAPSNKDLSKEDKALAKVYKTRMETLLQECKAIPNLEAQLALIKQLPAAEYDTQQWELLDSLTRILRYLAANLKVTFQQLGKTDYVDITLAAIEALGDEEAPTDIALALDYNIQHILIDEFQDTSTTQLTLLQALTRGWQTDDGRTLFIVGDAMQSCYRFRDANVGIFLDARKQGIGDIALEAIDLTVNFRSQQGIVAWVNTQFSRVFPAQNNSARGAVSYQHSTAMKTALEGEASEWHLLTSDKNRNNERGSTQPDQATYIAQLIQSQRTNHPEDSIAILVRNKAHAKVIIPELAKRGIDYRATDIDSLNTCMPVCDLLSLTRALLNPNDRMAWVAILRAPWCGLNMQDLLLATQDTEKPIVQALKLCLENQALSDHGHYQLDRFYCIMQQTISQQGRFPLSVWVQRTWLSLGGPALLINAQDSENITRFFDVLEREQQAGSIANWHRFKSAIDHLFAQQKNRTENPVEIMTIHKAKGLEFDRVIVPGLERATRASDKELITWMEKPSSKGDRLLLIAALNAKGQPKDKLYEYIHHQHKENDALEVDRLLYVACTRAIKKLHLVANIVMEDDAIKKPAEGTLLNRLWDTIENKEQKITTCSASFNNHNTHPNIILGLSREWQRPNVPEQSLLKPYRGNNALAEISGDNIAKPDALLQREQRYFGTIVHLALQQISDSGYQHWHHERIQRHLPFWRSQLSQHGMSPVNIDDAMDRLEKTLYAMLNDARGCWILDNSHQESATELVIYNRQGKHIIDRTFIATDVIKTDITSNDAANNIATIASEEPLYRWIIDYKTGSLNEDDMKTYRKQLHHKQLHHKQLQNYANLFKGENKPVRTGLYFPETAQWLEVDNHC